MHDQTTTGHAGGHAQAPGGRPVAVLSSVVLRAAWAGYRESRADFAGRAGVGLHVVEGAEDGTCPAWALPYAEFTALAEAVAVLNPSLRGVFSTAAACDLLLTSVMRGDQAFSTDVLADDSTRDLAVGLLRWGVTGEFRLPDVLAGLMPVAWAWHEECGGWLCPACGRCLRETGFAGCGHRGQLLADAQVALLRQRAAELAGSASPDAWVGAEILAVFGGAR
jgi:hypothetical protein